MGTALLAVVAVVGFGAKGGLWRYPWPELRVIPDGPRLRIHHQGQEAGTLLLEQPGAVQEIRLAAGRHGGG